MEEKPKNRKKGAYLLMAAFLAGGGGIFLYFIIQGSEDLAGPKNANFHYGGVAVRESMTPFFKYLGVTSDEEKTYEAVVTMFKNRAAGPGGGKLASADISDWMGKPSAGIAPSGPNYGSGGGSRGGSASASAGAPTTVPKMGGKGGGGLGAAGGGGTKSSGGVARFSGGGGSGTTNVSASASGAAGSGAEKGTLGHLRGAQALLSEGLRSGSAMNAKGKWDKSFGVGGGGGHMSGNMAYGKSLVGLDTIKSGDVLNLKTTGSKSLKAPPPSAPAYDKEASAMDPKLSKAKEDATNAAKDAAKNLSSTALNGATKSATGDNKNGDAKDEKPPDDVRNTAEAMKCSGNCTYSDGSSFEDGTIEYKKDGDNWTASFHGHYTSPPPENTITSYREEYIVSDGELIPTQAFAGPNINRLEKIYP